MAHEIGDFVPTGVKWHGQVIRADNGEVLDNVSGELMVRLMQRNAADLAAVTNRVMEDKDRQIDELRHTLGCIRTKIGELCEGPYAPNPAMIMDLLYPTRQAVQRYAEEIEQ